LVTPTTLNSLAAASDRKEEEFFHNVNNALSGHQHDHLSADLPRPQRQIPERGKRTW